MNPQEKLKEIEERFLNDQDDGQDFRWVIDRVKKLESALKRIREKAEDNLIAAIAEDALFDLELIPSKALEDDSE